MHAIVDMIAVLPYIGLHEHAHITVEDNQFQSCKTKHFTTIIANNGHCKIKASTGNKLICAKNY